MRKCDPCIVHDGASVVFFSYLESLNRCDRPPGSAMFSARFALSARATNPAVVVRFADLSEYGYGVAILSESKYGFSCQSNVFRISLLRAATAPDAEQDQGSSESRL